MPFKSEKQRKWMHANEPKMAKKWEKKKDESSKEYGKSLKKIANDKKLKAISSKDKELLKKLAKLLQKEGFADKLTKKMKKHKGTKVKKTKPIKLRGLSGRGKISHFGMEESAAEKEKIFNMLVKRGDTPTDARYEVDKSYDFVKKRFKKASVAKKAEIISALSKYESVNEAMSESQRFKVYNSLKKGDIVSIKYDSSIQKGTKYIPYVVSKGKTKLMKGKIERIILKSPSNPRFKAYLYNRNGDVSLALGDMAASIVDMKKGKVKESVKEEKKRDYKAEYKKFQSSTKSKKYRAELNKYNRKKGTYGNGDGKDASHKGGKIVGFESQSKNRGRAEKSRLKKEGVITENPAAIAAGVRAAMARAKEKELSAGGGKKVKVSTALSNKSHPQHKQAKGIIQRIKDKAKSMLAKTKKKKAEPKKQSKSDANFYARQFGVASESVNEGEKRAINQAYTKFYGAYKDFANASMDLAKYSTKISGDKTDQKIILNNYKKYVIPFMGLMQSWNRGKQKNPHIDEGFGGQLKGADKKKFEKARIKNGEQLGYKLTGTSDVKVVSEKLKK